MSKLAIVGSPDITDRQVLVDALDGFRAANPGFNITQVLICPGPGTATLVREWALEAGHRVQEILSYPERFGSWAPYVQAVEMGHSCNGLLIVQSGQDVSPGPRWLETLVGSLKPDAAMYLYCVSTRTAEDYKAVEAQLAEKKKGSILGHKGRAVATGRYRPSQPEAQDLPRATVRDPLAARVSTRYSESAMCCPKLQPDLAKGVGLSLPHGHQWQCPACGLWWLVVAEASPEPGIPDTRVWQVNQSRRPAADTGPKMTGPSGPVQDLRQGGPELWRRVVASRLGVAEADVTQEQVDRARAEWASLWQGVIGGREGRGL